MNYGNVNRMLTPEQVREIRETYAHWQELVEVRRQLLIAARTLQSQIAQISPRRLAEQRGLSRDTIMNVAARRYYKEIR